jgi:orotidine-5'-phosphate decarboxylase
MPARTMKRMTAKEKLIVALDVETVDEARRLVDSLKGVVGMFKIGSQLFTAAGPELVREIIRAGEKVFLDLKFHDIPNTVAAAGVEAARLGVSIFNVHAAGGLQTMERTAEAVADVVAREKLPRPSIVAVTVLTSSRDATLKDVGVNSTTEEVVRRLARLTDAAGLDGVVASPREVEIVRSAVTRGDFIVITPGIRMADASRDDQERITTPRAAVLAGSDYLVVGRPIIKAANPARAAAQIIDEMDGDVVQTVASEGT